MQMWALIVDSFRESRDRKIFWVMAAISLLIALTMFCISFKPGRIEVLFGMWEFKTDLFTDVVDGKAVVRTEQIATLVIHYIMELTIGWGGVALALIATAGFFPAFIDRGSIDVVLSKPISRWRVFLGKYLGSLVFIFLQASFFVLLTLLVIGVRWGTWIPGYLLTIPLIVLLFSYVYCVSVWVAIHFRSTVAAVLVSFGAWFAFSGVQTTAALFDAYPSWQQNRTAYAAFRVTKWVVPKTQDITYLAARWSGAGTSGELLPDPENATAEDREAIQRATKLERKYMAVNPVLTIGSSLLFEALVVMLAMWKFARTDY